MFLLVAGLAAISALVPLPSVFDRPLTEDEGWTVQRVQGRSSFSLPSGFIASAGELRTAAPLRVGFDEAVRVFAAVDPHASIGFMLIVRALSGYLDPIRAARLVSLTAHVLSVPLLFLFARQLFGRTLPAFFTALLFTASPAFSWYAGLGRCYSLWTLVIIAASWLLLRTLSKRSTGGVAAYALVNTAGLYLHPFQFFVLLAHSLFVLLQVGRKRLSLKSAGPALTSQFIAAAAFAPWLYVIGRHSTRILNTTRWLDDIALSPLSMLRSLASQIVYTLAWGNEWIDAPERRWCLLALPVLLLPVVTLVRNWRKRESAFILALLCTPWLLPLLRPNTRSIAAFTQHRYMIPFHLAIILAVSSLVFAGIRQSRGGAAMAALCISLLFVSGIWFSLPGSAFDSNPGGVNGVAKAVPGGSGSMIIARAGECCYDGFFLPLLYHVERKVPVVFTDSLLHIASRSGWTSAVVLGFDPRDTADFARRSSGTLSPLAVSYLRQWRTAPVSVTRRK